MELSKNLLDLQNAFLVLHFIRMGNGRCVISWHFLCVYIVVSCISKLWSSYCKINDHYGRYMIRWNKQRKSIYPLWSFPLIPCFSKAEKWNTKLWALNVVSYAFKILAFTYHHPSNTVISFTCFVFTVMGRGILYSYFVNVTAFGRTVWSNETKQFT